MPELKAFTRDLSKHKYKGYKVHETANLECSGCGKLICEVAVVQMPKDSVSLCYRGQCWNCGDYSYPVEIFGKVIVGNNENKNVILANSLIDDENDTITLVMKEKV